VKGRKRHIVVDTQGSILKAHISSAEVSDSAAGQTLLAEVARDCPRLQHLWVDAGYKAKLIEWIQQQLGWTVEVVTPPHVPSGQVRDDMLAWMGEEAFAQAFPTGFQVLARRWVVERTFGWMNTWRRLSKDYELLEASTQAAMYIIMCRILLRRLASQSISD
jgi:putative transposase